MVMSLSNARTESQRFGSALTKSPAINSQHYCTNLRGRQAKSKCSRKALLISDVLAMISAPLVLAETLQQGR